MTTDPRGRREEILDTASRLFASSGMRTSLQEVADACGIKAGSLYHHFESKEEIFVALLRRYHAELEKVAHDASVSLADDPLDMVTSLATAIAECAVRNSAAVQFTFYEPPAGAGHELVLLARHTPTSIEIAMLETLRAGRARGLIRPGLDLAMLADRISQTMLHAALGLFHAYTDVARVARLLCGIVLHGVAAEFPDDDKLDHSDAMTAVGRVIDGWDAQEPEEDGRAALIRRAGRAEFGRRGYEVTTIRDIASAVGLSTGSVYRVIGSKEELLASIMSSFAAKVMAGWEAALDSGSTAVEKLDALAWLHINVLEKFSAEFRIQLAWLRQSPPDVINPGWSFAAVVRYLKTLLSDGTALGQIRVDGPSAELTARAVIELTWVPEQIVRSHGKRAALTLARDTVLRGVAARN